MMPAVECGKWPAGRSPDWEEALAGRGPLFEALLDERTHALAAPLDRPGDAAGGALLACASRLAGRRWGLQLEAVARVEPLPHCCRLPGRTGPVLGLALVAGRRCMVADLDALAGWAPPRVPGRSGHAVLLRAGPLAVVVDAALGVERQTPPLRESGLAFAPACDPQGLVAVDAGVLVAVLLGKDGPG